MSNTSRRFDLTPVTVEGRRVHADDGAVAQQGSKPVFRCSCGATVVWLKSARTGRSYLAECFRYANGGFYYVGASLHTWERHDAKVADSVAFNAAEDANLPASKRAAFLAGMEATPGLTDEMMAKALHMADQLWPVAS